MLRIALYEPEIPPNTGNIIRLCANTGFELHLIHPLGFRLDDRGLRRAGLDHHARATIHEHFDWAAFRAALPTARIWAFTTRGRVRHDAVRYAPGDVLLFGPETRGLPQTLLETLPPTHWLRLPMCPGARSLNLANAAAVAAYTAWGQLGYPGAED